MYRFWMGLMAAFVVSTSAHADFEAFPREFKTQTVVTNGAKLHVRVGGSGPAVVLLHGYGESGDMWVPLAKDLARDHTVIVPDLRGMGLSDHPASGYDKKTQATDVAGVLDTLKIDRADVVAHDIGNMVAYAFAAQYRQRVRRLVLMDAPLPGVGPWEKSFGAAMADVARFAANDVEGAVIPESGHWIMEENPQPAVKAVRAFLSRAD